MWRSINTSFSKYSIELAQLLCRCLKDPFRDKALARYKLNLKQTNYVNGVPQSPEFPKEFK
ncbi:Mitochondrial ATP synthase epsilon chain family protein [Theileria parva strain Muguga]|uniref:mitochondrial ATP synthase F1 subunit epsilon n=1 Tax=Theileria parva strain Muguga TaxID=333668 RepID=UPI001C61E604|nr:mitochondrial ATP synthase F1 subunit epsilon [Theileria parva strain Muguga]EAN31013.2 Mitochondrial ATP synthase epsilon chain family protein [Theileria parva strain Muguga]